MLILKNLGCTRLLVSAAYMPIENEHILVQCKYIKKHICVLLSINMCFMERKMILATNLLAGAWLGHFARVLLLSLCHGHLCYIRLLCPVLGVTSYKVSIAYLSQHCQSRCQSQTLIYSNVSLPNYCSLICGGRRESTRLINEPVLEK